MVEGRQQIGVFLSELSYTKGLLLPSSAYLEWNAESVAREVAFDILKLLLIFDVVHIPLGDYFFLPSTLYHRAASLLLKDRNIRIVASNGLLSVTFSQSSRSLAIKQYREDYDRFGWRYGQRLDDHQLNILTEFPVGFDFNNTQAGLNAAAFLDDRLPDCEPAVATSYKEIRQTIDATKRTNNGAFIMEDFLVRLNGIHMPSSERKAVFRLLHDAYYVEPNHLADDASVKNKILFCSYDSRITLSSIVLPVDSSIPVRYFYSPTFIARFFSKWVTREEWYRFEKLGPSVLLKIRSDSRWDRFVEYFHHDLVPNLSRGARLSYLTRSLPEHPDSLYAELSSDIVDYLSHLSEDVDTIASNIRFGGIARLVLRQPGIKLVVDNLARPSIREFMKEFRYLLRDRGA